MTNLQKIYSGISKTAWGYFFLYFNLNINTISLLPSFVGFWLFLSAIDLLKEEERDLTLLRPLAILLGVWHGAEWVASWFGGNLDGMSQFLDLIIALANLYFHFQLLTNLASIAAKYQADGARFDTRLLKYRTLQTLMLTGILILTSLAPLLADIWAYISLLLGLVYIIAGICLMKALLDLRRNLTNPETTQL